MQLATNETPVMIEELDPIDMDERDTPGDECRAFFAEAWLSAEA